MIFCFPLFFLLLFKGSISNSNFNYTCQDSPRIESMSSEWTNEKHSLYLKSMEASFVNQLYNSIDILGWPSQKERSVPNFSGEANCSPSCTRQVQN